MARAIKRSKQGSHPELHHVFTTKGHADCHQKQYAAHRPNNANTCHTYHNDDSSQLKLVPIGSHHVSL